MTEQTPKQKLTTAMANLKLTIDATFVPWSKSRNAKPNPKTTDRSLNWKITLKCNGRDVLTTNYSAGIGHCPSYRNIQGPMPIDKSEAIIWETERGQARRLGGGVRDGKPILPDACDVMYSLISDADVIDHPDFESWASDCGYDPDSRSAERTYRACLDTALALRNAIGESGMTLLREAARDY